MSGTVPFGNTAKRVVRKTGTTMHRCPFCERVVEFDVMSDGTLRHGPCPPRRSLWRRLTRRP